MTMVLAVLDPHRHELTLVDAGHPPAYLYQAGKAIEAVEEAHMRLPLGVMDDAEYLQVTHRFTRATGWCFTQTAFPKR